MVGREFSIPEEIDLSGLGVDLEVFSEESSIQEATEYWPGIGVLSDGYIPIAGCLIGTGDPYFIMPAEGVGGKLYRIYHDEVSDKGYNPKSAITIVLESYEEILNYVVCYSVWSQDGNGKNTEIKKDLLLEQAQALVKELKLLKDRKKYWHDQTEKA